MYQEAFLLGLHSWLGSVLCVYVALETALS